MFNTGSSYSLSDIAAVSGRNGGNGFGGDGDGWWIILLFLFALGGWGNGFGGNKGAGGAQDIAYSFDMNGLENGVRGIQQGLCDGFYAVNTGMLNGFAGVQNALCQGFSGVHANMNENTNSIIQTINADTIAGMQNTNSINAGLTALGTQIAQCCCDSRYETTKGFADIGYALATQACDTRRAITDSTREIIDFLTQDRLATLQAENQTLKFAASQQAQNAYLVNALREPCPVPAYVVPNPNGCYGAGFGVYQMGRCGFDC